VAPAERPHVIVVGAGIGGLVLARDLAIADVRVTLLETAETAETATRSASLGAPTAVAEVGGVEVDLGADAMSADSGAARALAAELGLELALPVRAASWVVHGPDDAHPLPALSLLGIPADPLTREVIALAGTGAALRAQLDALIPMLRPTKHRTIADLVRRRMGRRVLARLVAPMVRGRYGVSPTELPIEVASARLSGALAFSGTLTAAVRTIADRRPADDEVVGVVGGMHRLATSLATSAERVGVEIRTTAPVASLAATVVELTNGDRLEGRVVAAPPMPSGLTRPVTVVVAAVESAALDASPRGAEAVVAAGARGIGARALAQSSRIWPWLGEALSPHRHLVRLEYDDAPLGSAAVEADVRAITGVADVRVVDLAQREWWSLPHNRPVAVGAADVLTVGGAGVRRGIAEAIEDARASAADLVAELRGADA